MSRCRHIYEDTATVRFVGRKPGPLVFVAADKISPDNARLWDIGTSERADKDRFRAGLERVAEGYQEAARRRGIWPEGGPADFKSPRTIQ